MSVCTGPTGVQFYCLKCHLHIVVPMVGALVLMPSNPEHKGWKMLSFSSPQMKYTSNNMDLKIH